MKQLNNNTFGKNSRSRHWKKLYFLKNTMKKIHEVATVIKYKVAFSNLDCPTYSCTFLCILTFCL